jgi:hypothetical protein
LAASRGRRVVVAHESLRRFRQLVFSAGKPARALATTLRSETSVFYLAAGKLSKMNQFAELDGSHLFRFSFLM